MVGFTDGAIMAHLGPPDMRAPIGFALNWPDRYDLPLERLNFGKLGTLTFQAPDPERFPALRLAAQAMEMGGLAGTVFNAAKEQALDLFLERRIGFLDMARVVETVLKDAISGQDPALDSIIAVDKDARARAIFAAE